MAGVNSALVQRRLWYIKYSFRVVRQSEWWVKLHRLVADVLVVSCSAVLDHMNRHNYYRSQSQAARIESDWMATVASENMGWTITYYSNALGCCSRSTIGWTWTPSISDRAHDHPRRSDHVLSDSSVTELQRTKQCDPRSVHESVIQVCLSSN